ncbi:MAG TPA: hypothetical protein VN029_08170 [Sphingomonas sp.]|nr:hypothetical protein [Sphingomonas sp.]
MRRLDKLPPAFKRYDKAGGAFIFAAFDEADDSEKVAIAAIRALLRDDLDETALRSIGHRRIKPAEFLGEHCDPVRRTLIKRGTWRTRDGRELVDPPLRKLGREWLIGGGYGMPLPGEGGQFARAFIDPPHSLGIQPREIQELFDEILDFLLPPEERSHIRDWTSPRLPEASPWFKAGMAFWGVFLFTIHQPERGRLIALAASATA